MSKTISPKWALIKQDLKSLAIGLGIALLGALATYLQENIPNVDFGNYTVIVVAVNSVIVNAIRKFVASTIYVK